MTCHSVSSPPRTVARQITFELAYFQIRKTKVGTGGTAQDQHVITSVHDVVRVDDVVGKRRHVPVPGVAVCFPPGQRGLLENLEPVVG